MGILRSTLLTLSHNGWLERQMRHRRFARRAVARFMPGEDVASAVEATEALNRQNIPTVLTQLGEDITDRDQAAAVAVHYLDVLAAIASRGLSAHLSIKLTQFGIALSDDFCREQVALVVSRAAQAGTTVWVDMEGSEYTDRTLTIFRSLHASHANVGVCLQAYLRRTASDLESLLRDGALIRLVKGAYREPAAVAFPRKREVDARYFEHAVDLLQAAPRGGGKHGIATHDMALIARIQRHMESRGIEPVGVEFQMLYGIRGADQLALAAAGYRVRVLISYGSAWFPWYMRRLAERPANLWFVVRSLF
jgi:proline dehydrogenase